jgi:hypothetical protein
MQTIENTRIYHGSSESAQDIALAGALLSRMPEWPRWERLSDVQALLSYAVEGGERSAVIDAHGARREACYRAEEGAL